MHYNGNLTRRIMFGLFHCRAEVQVFHALALNVQMFQPLRGYVGVPHAADKRLIVPAGRVSCGGQKLT